MQSLRIVLFLLITCGYARATEIRQFNLRTIESLGRQLYEHRNQTVTHLSDPEARALQSAKAALKGHVNKSYKFVVPHDPTRNGYLVYALATSRNPDDVVLGVHYRITISTDGNRVERVDALSRRELVIIKGRLYAGTEAFSVIIECSRNDFRSQSIMTCTRTKSEFGVSWIADAIRIGSSFSWVRSRQADQSSIQSLICAGYYFSSSFVPS